MDWSLESLWNATAYSGREPAEDTGTPVNREGADIGQFEGPPSTDPLIRGDDERTKDMPPRRPPFGSEVDHGTGLTGSAASCQRPPAREDGGKPMNGTHPIEGWLKTLHPELMRQARNLCPDKATAEDIVQDVLRRAWEGRDEIAKKENIPGYLATCVRNAFWDWCRNPKRRRTESIDLPTSEQIPMPVPDEQRPYHRIPTETFLAAVNQLPLKEREVFQLHFFDGFKYEEIAELLGIREGTVGSRIHSAKKKLRDILFPRTNEDEE